MHHHQSDSMDDFIVEDNPMDLDNIEAHKELAQMLGHDEQPDGAMWEFRQTVGSLAEGPGGAVGVEFVNYICEVLGLESEMELEVQNLKRNCLFFLDTTDSEFKEPSGSIIIPNTVCPQCQNHLDLDLCHTDVLYERAEGKSLLVCELCGTQFDTEVMEAALMEALPHRSHPRSSSVFLGHPHFSHLRSCIYAPSILRA